MKTHPLIYILLVAVIGLSACDTLQTRQEDQGRAVDTTDPLATYSVISGTKLDDASRVVPGYGNAKPTSTGEDAGASSTGLSKPIRYSGTDEFVKPPARSEVPLNLPGDGIVLNFENADLREVVRTILGDFLKISYIYDPRVQGTVSLQTTRQLAPEDVLATLETLLRMNGAALVAGETYRVIPADEAPRGNLIPQLGDDTAPLPPGYRVIIVPLRYVSVTQMEKLLEPFVTPKSILRVDAERNMLIIAGTSGELGYLMETVGVFDVDWLAGKSIGLFPLEQVSPETMIEELDTIFGTQAEGPLAGLVRFEPVMRLNALLVISTQSAYLKKVEEWIRRLDRSTTAGQNLYVYYLQNGKAADVAKILTEVFSNTEARISAPEGGRLAPGAKPVELSSGTEAGAQPESGAPVNPVSPRGLIRQSEGLAFSESANIRIIADEVNNALLILASPQDHRMVAAAIEKLDIVPLQVLIEATIAEVKLTDKMRFGLQWWFRSGDVTGVLSRTAPVTDAAQLVTSLGSGFSLVAQGVDAKVILDALDAETSINVVSSPHLMVLDNQTASLQVGDEVPVVTRVQQSVVVDNSNIVNNVEYRNTGVIMSVTPRVNTSGSIIMDVEQEVSNVVPSDNTSLDLTPTISQRKFKSSVVVQSGDTVVLGGLIFDFSTKQREGLPLLSKIPVLGALFGSTALDDERTELVMLITPRLVRNRYEARQVTEEVRRRLKQLRQLQEETVPTPVWDRLSPKRRSEQPVKAQ
ncbi:MAG: type II secretion system secretin GspD [Gammaproteobacteria bacterium]|nr:type II secretion system secretin GspD [Gammaproteobacteria bacterium]